MKNISSPFSKHYSNGSIILLILLLATGRSFGQLDIILHETYPGTSANYIAEDYEGNVLVAGANFIKKYDPTMSTYLWTSNILPPEGFSGFVATLDMTIDGLGNSYITGRYSGSVAFGSTILTSLVNSQHIYQKTDAFVAKLDATGNFLWAISLGTNAGTDESHAIALDGAGNIYITGLFCNKICSGPPQASPPEIEDLYLAKLNNSGSLIWQKRFPPSKLACENYGIGFDITVDGSGNIFATGTFRGTFKFGNTAALTLTSQGLGDVFTIKLNNTGTALWAKGGHGSMGDNGQRIYVDATGNINVGGQFGKSGTGNITFAPYTLSDVDGNAGAPGPLVSNAFLVQYTSAGTVNWAVNPAPVSGISNDVNSIISGGAGSIRISMSIVGIKSYTFTGTETEFIEFENNLTLVGGYPYSKWTLSDMEESASGYIFSGRTRCGTVPVANLVLENQNCTDCADWYTCNAPSYPDTYVIKSDSPPAVNTEIVPRSIPEILGHTYLGTFNGHTYYMSDCPTAWYDALFAAQEMGGYLATITSQAEDDFLAQFAPYIDCESLIYGYNDRIGGAWIGLLTNDNDQDGICQMVSWINGEPIGYTNWSPGYVFESSEPPTGYCGPAGIIGYPGGNNIGFCFPVVYGWFTNFYTNATSRYIVEFDDDPSCHQANKTYVCHNGNTLCINTTSLQNHLNHGDYEGPCSPCNNYLVETHGHTPTAEGHPLAEKENAFNPNRNDDITVYPNPARDEMAIRLPASFETGTLRIVTLNGEVISSKNVSPGKKAIIDISALASGLYVIDLRSPEGYWQTKFIKAE